MENSTKGILKKWHALVAIFFLAAFATNVQAQNVTISPRNGSMICALTQGSPNTQLGFQMGAFGTWRHNQLSLTMTGSNYTDTEDGQLTSHSNHFITGDKCTYSPEDPTRTPANYICTAWGTSGNNTQPGYITIALPKGYRFTSYTFHLSHDVATFGQNTGQATTFNITTSRAVTMTENNPANADFTGNLNSVTLAANSAEVQEFTRTGDDMGNILYFTTTAGASGFYAITFRYVELTFTADADAPISLLPGSQVSTGASMLEVPFNTGKVDLGQITQGTYQGATRVSYQYNSVTNMPANMLLYEAESIKDGTGFDGTSGKVAYNQSGHSITTAGNYFQFTPSGTGEQKYFLETPVSAKISGTDTENPVQFRMTEATINYSNQTEQSFHITIEIDGTTYYLGTNGRFSTDVQTVWQQDDAGHIHSGTDYIQGTNGNVNIVQSANNATVYTILDNGTIRYTRNSGGYRYLKAYPNYTWQGGSQVLSYYSGYISDSNNYTTAVIEDVGGGTSDGATLYVYDENGENPQTIPVNGTGSVTLKNLNNDAIKFGVQGGVALLNFTIKLQSLNPYVDQMSVVMNDTDNGKNLRMTQTFTSDDFSVGGDKFVFYLPHDCIGDDISMTFEDLYSKYGDETYDHTGSVGTNNSRYNFVMSQHNAAYGANDNIYTNTAEAASGTKESARLSANSMIRTKVGTVGDTPFRFNNADELATQSGHLTEYPFTLNNYANQTNPGAGQFVAAHFTNIGTTENETFYVFTTDETRYNIAPTTATQHRAYAFYAMEVELICHDYDPIVEFKPIYTNSFNETDAVAFYGVEVSAPAEVTTPLASDLAVHKAIAEKIANPGDDDVPESMTQILYLDMSKLKGVYHSTAVEEEDEEYEISDFNVLKAKFATNALVFLPINTTSTFDNFAYAMKGEVEGSFKSANNIILTDKHPFYSPYDIQVDAANTMSYQRKITTDKYGKVQNASLILPFAVALSGGKHTNSDGTSFSLHTMQASQALRVDDDKVVAFFPPLANVTTAAANTPYLVKIDENGNSSAAGITFTISQPGATIAKTTEMASDYTFSGTASSGVTAGGNSHGAGTFTFTPKGTYAGQQVPKANNIFYFANNVFVSSLDYTYDAPIKILPFRAYYNTQSNGAKLSSFTPIFEEGEGDVITAIAPASAVLDVDAPVYDLQGRKVATSYREAKSLQSGMYVVNGVKIIVK